MLMMLNDHERSPSDTKQFELCQEYCDGNIAICYCPQCWTNYCEECYNKEHKLKRRKEDHDKVPMPRQLCPEHKLTLEYQNKLENSFMCCMCVKEMAPGEFAASSIESIDSIALVIKFKLEEMIAQLDSLADSLRKKMELCGLNITSCIGNARNEVKRFFNALKLLLAKQEESFQHQLTNLLEATQDKPVLREVNKTLTVAENLVGQGKALLGKDSLVMAKEFDGLVQSMDEILENKKIKTIVLPTLQVSVHVHRNLLEMVRHPGYISSKFDGISKDHQVQDEKSNVHLNERFQNQFSIYNTNNNDQTDTFDQRSQSIPPRPIPLCSPPLSLPEDDENAMFSLMPAYPCSSSPVCLQHNENSSLQSSGVNTDDDRSLSDATQEMCACSEDERDSVGQTREETEDRHVTFIKPKKNSDLSRKKRKRKLSQPGFFLTYNRKSRRNAACQELSRCDQILTELWASDDSFPFSRAVDGKKILKYYEVIKNPIDLSKIKTKLQSVSYDSVYDFVDDIKLMFDNCYQFNQPNSTTFENGKNLEKQFIMLLRQHFPLIYYESSTSQNRTLIDETLGSGWTGKQIIC